MDGDFDELADVGSAPHHASGEDWRLNDDWRQMENHWSRIVAPNLD